MQRTLTILKPDTVSARRCGAIIDRLEREGFAILALRRLHLTQAQAEAFYAVHRERPFFASLVKFMTEGPVWVMALEREDAVAHLRAVMGATNPANAEPGTIRADYASSIERNAIHGSDSPENAAIELAFFFPGCELA
ncbi:MAG TPA: nucleoside-diphosphate kinase [Thermoanaerobaculaceae bacterium]|nr:nucleoside-diphosphate kinase [Thermoanaerobaculaceae bacterium]HRS16687.1 nucleoside-diphosphate kinase [Thermoanaerobaculaceae bacterium]